MDNPGPVKGRPFLHLHLSNMLSRIVARVIIFIVFLIAAWCCRKGEFIPTPRFMKLKIDAFYPDSALFSTVLLNDQIIQQQVLTGVSGFQSVLDRELDAFPGDSCKLKVLIVKKNSPNTEIDSIIHFTNNNEYLLLQLDPATKPVLINKKLENAAAIKPGKDSIKVRVFYNAADSITYPPDYPVAGLRGKTVDSLHLQLYTLTPEDGMYKQENIKKAQLIKGIKINGLNNYFSVRDGSTEGKLYGYDMLDAKTSQVIQQYKVGTYNGFIKGNFETGTRSSGLFQTCRLIKRSLFDDDMQEEVLGLNSYFLFGLN